MKCPMQHLHKTEPGQSWKIVAFFECLNEECAWWDKEHSQCSMRTISNALVKIKDGMPH